MMANIDIQIVWNENKGEVQLFIGDFRIGLPPALCEALEKELAAARRIPERARQMAENYLPSPNLVYCDCTCADKCPQGKVGSADRCAIFKRNPQNENHGPGYPLSHSPLDCRANEAGDGMERKTSAVAREPETTG